MKIEKIAVAAMTVLCAVSLVTSCKKVKEQEKPVKVVETNFTVGLNSVQAEYAEVVVRHTGAADVTWFGFVTEDVTGPEQDLISAQLAQLDKKALHVGKSQTVAISNLKEYESYRYIAFPVNEAGETFGKSGSITFSTSPKFDVEFAAEATDVQCHEATFSVSHEGNPILTYTYFVTDDVKTEASVLAAADFAEKVSDGKLAEGVELLSGNTQSVTVEDIKDESSYRLIVYGIYDNNGTCVYYGTPADVAFVTPLDLVGVYFSAAVSNLTKNSADVAVSYSAKATDLTWYGFVTTDVTTAASALVAEKVAAATEADWQAGPKTVQLTGLTPDTEYRYIATGINAQGVFGTPADVKFKAEDPDKHSAYEDFIGEWKVNGVAFTVSAKETGSTYTIDGFPGASSARGSIKSIVAQYDSTDGVLYVEDQDLGQYNDPSTYNYGPLKDFFAGAKWATMSDNSEQYWAVYPFQSSEKNKIFTFVAMKDGTYELRPAGEVEATCGGWVILSGTYAGQGNVYGGVVELPASVTKVDKVAAQYTDFLGTWKFGSEVITISQKTAGSTYSITGFSGQSSIYGDNKVIVGNYDAAKKEFYIMEQKLGAFNTATAGNFSEDYGDCDDHLSGYFPYGSSGYFAYPFNTDTPARLFTAYLNSKGEMEVISGACQYGTFSSFDFIWVIRNGEYAGKGNNYTYPDHGYEIPSQIFKTSSTSAVTSVSSEQPVRVSKVGSTRAPQAPFFSIAK